jgi:predicted DNA-binding transcriptional regulator YafY
VPGSKKTARRLERLLAVVPFVVRHPGTTLEELSRLFGVSEGELTGDLNILFLTGLPPYTPGDLIDVQIEEGRVWISMADHFSRPVRLTSSEAAALYLKGTELLGAPGLPEAEDLRSALDKLAGALGQETLGTLRAEIGDGGGSPGPLEIVRDAAAGSDQLEIDYYAAHRDEVATRRIDPEEVFSAMGNWYVVAWDHRADAERLFRVDRIRDARPTGRRFEPRGLAGAGRDLYSPSAEDIEVRLLLGPGARWVAEYYAVADSGERDGDLEVTLPTKDLAWVAKLVLRLGGQVEILGPPELRELARRVADDTLALYRKG